MPTLESAAPSTYYSPTISLDKPSHQSSYQPTQPQHAPTYNPLMANQPTFTCSSQFDLWVALLLIGVLIMMLGFAIWTFVIGEWVSGVILLASGAIIPVIAFFFPKRLEVWPDSVKVCIFINITG